MNTAITRADILRTRKSLTLPSLSVDLTECVSERPRISAPSDRVEEWLKKIRDAAGTAISGWHGTFSPRMCRLEAYVGPRHCVVATAQHEDMTVGLRLLAWELEELCQ